MTTVSRPVPALRVGLVGKRSLGSDPRAVGERLRRLFGVIESALVAVPRHDANPASPYGAGRPLLTLVSGLAEGADQTASTAFLADSGSGPDRVERAIGAIFPFPVAAYVEASPMADLARFHALRAAARYVVELGGQSRTDLPHDDPAGKAARVDAYRGQAEMVLRHADILVAVDDLSPGRGGGTEESTGRAIDLGLPVIRLVIGAEGVRVLRAREEAEDPTPSDPDWEQIVTTLVRAIVAPPALVEKHGHGHGHVDHGAELAAEFFGDAALRRRWRQGLSRWFERRFHAGPTAPDDVAAPPFESYRQRADTLNRHYSRLYRGTFLVGYGLAVAAVCLAVLSLIVILRNPSAHSPSYTAWWVLLGLGLAKLVAVIWIQRAAHSANAQRWSERAVDYRYLAEGLRTMAYLPLTGSFRPPEALSAPFATRVVAQSNVDRLLHAVIRQASPETVTAPAADGVIRPDPRAALATIRDRWLGGQIAYHRRNAGLMAAMNLWLERAANVLSLAVILVVAVDIALLVADGLHWLPYEMSNAVHRTAPWLLFIAAIVPAAVASLNGIRFQSEYARLADRSERMIAILEGLTQRADAIAARAGQPGRRFREIDTLRLGEDVGRITLDEVAEWSALYAKEMVEP